jgi:hypothetical protein
MPHFESVHYGMIGTKLCLFRETSVSLKEILNDVVKPPQL